MWVSVATTIAVPQDRGVAMARSSQIPRFMENTTETRIDALCRKARYLIRAGEYFPGRLHFAALLAERLESEIGRQRAMKRCDRPDNGNGLGTAYERALNMYVILGDDVGVERVRWACADLMGTTENLKSQRVIGYR